MNDVRTVGIKDLKNNLSAYLRDVRRGVRILVTDRSAVVAELHEPGAAYAAPGGDDPVLGSWIRSGEIAVPARAKEPLPDPPLRLEEGIARRLLDEERAEERR